MIDDESSPENTDARVCRATILLQIELTDARVMILLKYCIWSQ
jgi:hypothetical protein